MRLDKYIVDLGLYPTRNKAQEAIKEGYVLVNGRTSKASYIVSETDQVTTTEEVMYVSRAAKKLLSMIDSFDIDFQDKTVLDVGSSTGGFTEVALEYGAKKVIAVDVGTDQMHPSLKSDPRVLLLEQTNILNVEKEDIPTIDFLVMDVSFVSIKKLLPHLKSITDTMYVLIKPQFETGGKHLFKGIVKDKAVHKEVLESLDKFCRQIDLVIEEVVASPMTGKDGNTEFISKITKRV